MLGLLLLLMPTSVIWEMYEWPTIYLVGSFILLALLWVTWDCLENLFVFESAFCRDDLGRNGPSSEILRRAFALKEGRAITLSSQKGVIVFSEAINFEEFS